MTIRSNDIKRSFSKYKKFLTAFLWNHDPVTLRNFLRIQWDNLKTEQNDTIYNINTFFFLILILSSFPNLNYFIFYSLCLVERFITTLELNIFEKV